MAVLIAVDPADGELLIFKQNESRVHDICEITDTHLCGDELHGHIIAVIDMRKLLMAGLCIEVENRRKVSVDIVKVGDYNRNMARCYFG